MYPSMAEYDRRQGYLHAGKHGRGLGGGAVVNHRLQVREWGAFLLMAKPEYRDDPDVLWNANGYKRNRDTVIVVGNMTNRRNNWLIIKLFQPDVGKEPTLFDNQIDEADVPPAPVKAEGKAKK